MGKTKAGPFRCALRWVGGFVGLIALLIAAVLVFLTVTEYKPADTEEMFVAEGAQKTLSEGDTIRVMTWNIGYGALGDNADFFMDGGSMVKTAEKKRLQRNLDDMVSGIGSVEPDILFLQEVDINSSRSEYVDEFAFMQENLSGMDSTFANNFLVKYLPYPIPALGKVNSGIAVFSQYALESAERIQLPIPFKWPVRMANLKRCLLVTRVPVQGSDKELVLVCLHLEAYDDGSGKAAQTEMLAQLLQDEAKRGNYVIAGGDFNQIFPGGLEAFPNEHPDLWTPGLLTEDQLPAGWSYAYSLDTPSCRLLNQPYNPADTANTQYYVIDGFILSPNVELELVENLDLGFANSDHNPVHISVRLAG